eukprot:6055599-Pyramimonas_sp.AAC.1
MRRTPVDCWPQNAGRVGAPTRFAQTHTARSAREIVLRRAKRRGRRADPEPSYFSLRALCVRLSWFACSRRSSMRVFIESAA